jgi:hypothetical protein
MDDDRRPHFYNTTGDDDIEGSNLDVTSNEQSPASPTAQIRIYDESDSPNKTTSSSILKYRKSYIAIVSIILLIILGISVFLKKELPPPIPIVEEKHELRFIHSPYKKEVLEVKDRFFEGISKANIEFADPSNQLLVGISIGPSEFQRRYLMRVHQIHPFKNFGVTFKFVMGAVDPSIEQDIQFENKTFGDIIILKNYTDSRLNARSTKPFVFFKHVEENMSPYKYVAKLDSDTFLNIHGLWDKYFTKTIQDYDFGLIALFIQKVGVFDWPQGAFEAVSWKAMLMTNRFYQYAPRSAEEEDIQISWFFYDAEIKIKQIEFTTSSSYDFRLGSTWSWLSDVNPDALRIHELKTDQDYLNVARCFTPEGINMTHVYYMRSFNWTFGGDD